MKHNAKQLFHSSIRITGSKTVYVDPWQVAEEPHDADLILVTHAHYDHYSPEDITRVSKPDTIVVVPEHMAGIGQCVIPGGDYTFCGIRVETVAAYNVGRPFHPKEDRNVGYIVTLDGVRYYIAGDTDKIPENLAVQCDVALVPVGGKFTMDAPEAAALVNAIRPAVAIPTHYGTVTDSADAGMVFRSLVDPQICVEIHAEA